MIVKKNLANINWFYHTVTNTPTFPGAKETVLCDGSTQQCVLSLNPGGREEECSVSTTLHSDWHS